VSTRYVSIQPDSVDIYFDSIARLVCENADDVHLLVAMAEEYESMSRKSGDADEKAFLSDAALKVRDLANWMTEHAP
jgi:hypothetical protein